MLLCPKMSIPCAQIRFWAFMMKNTLREAILGLLVLGIFLFGTRKIGDVVFSSVYGTGLLPRSIFWQLDGKTT